ncbi:MAG: 16S rRNA (uracil(1498)-N(3))-methyltransferase, partial [Verrucomicrobia bacterium]|nr:16S rRNA (uracil(1498)-N(3))-methyltransferase [Verrucomicrobiota bacterium]
LSVFDGEGRVAASRLLVAGKRSVEAEVLSLHCDPPPEARLSLIQAIPKGKLFEWILEKATELSASSIQPVLTERTVIQLDGQERARKQEKWQRVVVEACKQCGQNWLPTVHPPLALSEVLHKRLEGESLVASLHEGALPLREVLSGGLGSDVCVFVGPEGDFSAAEMAKIVAWGARPVTLGPLVLRVETAAMYCLSVLAHRR